MASAWGFSDGERMNTLSSASRPALRPGCRLSSASSPDSLLLIPEGALKLHGPSRRILELCDGRRSIDEITSELAREFPSVEGSLIAAQVTEFLGRLQERGAIELL
jgi:pyrroloquinoline quinone biosynthesis protein D